MKIPTGNVDLNKVETGISILQPGDYEVKVASMEVIPTEAGGERLRIKMTLEQPALTRDGEEIAPGFPIFGGGSLTTTPKYDHIKKLMVPLMDCFLGYRPDQFDTDDFLGKTGQVRVTTRRDDVYGESNEVKLGGWIPANKKK